MAGVFYLAQFLLPLPWQISWYEAFRLTIRHNFPFLVTLTRELRIRPPISGATPEAAKQLPKPFLKHKAGIINSHQAPVIFRGAAFIRGAGPGFLRLRVGERIVQVIDLRRHFRNMPVRALTRDGITVTTGVSTIFHVKHQEDPPDDRLQYPFDQEAIFKVNFLGNFKSDNDDMVSWSERVCRQAASALIGEVSRYSLDELFQPDESRAAPLEHIKGKIAKQVSKAFEKYGIEIILVGVSPFQVPDDIKQERIEIWRAEWERRIEVEQGKAEAERERRLKLARARAQIEMIEKLTDGLEIIHETGQDMTDVLALRFIEAIEEAESNAAVSAFIPSQIATHLKTIRSQVLGEDK
jgi:regulator of protease activity HflC (stomatin/prohibitin superfamily)